MLLLALWITTSAWHSSILDRHEFRQLQTALSTHWVKEAGFRLDYETPLFGPPWSIPLEFPVYQWVVAGLSRALGTGIEPTARAVSLAFFLATLPAVYCLAGLFKLLPSRRLLVVATVLASPTYLFYSRSFMIESTALCFSAWFLYTLTRAVRDGSRSFAIVASVCAVLASLAKITTFIVFLGPAALLTWIHWRHCWAGRQQHPAAFWRATSFATVPVLLAAFASLWWLRHGDHLKEINPFTGFLISSELTSWNWGTWAQRTSGEVWSENWSNISQFVLGVGPLAVLIFGTALVEPFYRRVAAWGTLFFLGGPLLFTFLYFRHDYYYFANAVFLLGAAGFILAGLWDSPRVTAAGRWLALVLVFGGQVSLFFTGYGRILPRDPPGLATVVRELVPPRDVVVVYGWDWNALLPYYAERRVIMVPDGRENEFAVLDDILSQLGPLRVSALIIRSDEVRHFSPDWIRERVNRFKLFDIPIATSADGDLYLPEEAIPAAVGKLRGRVITGVTSSSAPPSDPHEGKLQENDPASLALPFFKPAPERARSMFGFTPDVQAGQTILISHPASELFFSAPPGAKRIDAVFGVTDGAFAASNQAATDGVTIEVVEVQANGLRRVLFRRDLDPARTPTDRGPQAISLAEKSPLTGTLIFKITPGPKNNFNSDWAYWARIEIH